MAEGCPAGLSNVFKALMAKTERCVVAKAPGSKAGEANFCEEIQIGENHTWHAHPHGVATPSDVDVSTTRRLGKPLLCIGLVPTRTTVCFDSKTLKVRCRIK